MKKPNELDEFDNLIEDSEFLSCDSDEQLDEDE